MTLFNLIIVLSKKDKTKFIHDSNWYEIKIMRKKKAKNGKKKIKSLYIVYILIVLIYTNLRIWINSTFLDIG